MYSSRRSRLTAQAGEEKLFRSIIANRYLGIDSRGNLMAGDTKCHWCFMLDVGRPES